MREDYFEINSGEQINSIQNVYLTYSSIMKDLIDKRTHNDMMVNVCKDIYENKPFLEEVKTIPYEQKLFLARIIYKWAIKEWRNHPNLHQTQQQPGRRYAQLAVVPINYFIDILIDVFSEEVIEVCRYEVEAEKLTFEITKKKNDYNIIMRNGNSYEVFGRMIVKYNKLFHELKISYIEDIQWITHNFKKPQKFRVELFRTVKEIQDDITMASKNIPKIICNKQYQELFEKAKEKGYI